jgi:hypothetical protein
MNASVCVRDFRRRWKPQKERLLTNRNGQGTLIRFHRACSWLARVESMSENEDADLALVSLWIAFNSLYGQWDRAKREPKPDRECWRAFVDRMLVLDGDNCIVGALQEHKRLVISLLEDEYLNNKFWRDPKQRVHSNKMKHVAQSWYVTERWTTIIDELLDRIHLMRCQLVHGAATYGGQLNRTSLRRCVWMIRHLLTAFLTAWIDHGADKDWGPVCYPPQNSHAGYRAKSVKISSTRNRPG